MITQTLLRQYYKMLIMDKEKLSPITLTVTAYNSKIIIFRRNKLPF